MQRSVASKNDEQQVLAATVIGLQNLTSRSQLGADVGGRRTGVQRLLSVGVVGQMIGLRRRMAAHFPIMKNSGENI